MRSPRSLPLAISRRSALPAPDGIFQERDLVRFALCPGADLVERLPRLPVRVYEDLLDARARSAREPDIFPGLEARE
jgi:hypothetical protein